MIPTPRTISKNTVEDALHDSIYQTITNRFDGDIYDVIFPLLTEKVLTKDSNFLLLNNISPHPDLSSEEIKTACSLSYFWKTKTRKNIGDIPRYLNFMGYDTDRTRSFDIICIKNLSSGTTYALTDTITYEDYQSSSAADKDKYFVSNIIQINDHFNAFNYDLLGIISQKYIIIYSGVLDYSFNLFFDQKDNTVDGFDYGFDIAEMR